MTDKAAGGGAAASAADARPAAGPPIGRRGFVGLGAATAIALSTLPRPAIAQGRVEWRMVSAWPRNGSAPASSAERLVASIAALSDGRLTVRIDPAGEPVPALETFDAVAGGQAEMAHASAHLWQPHFPAAPLFTTVPFGLTPTEHAVWLAEGGGQALWDKLYRPAGVQPLLAGNIGGSMAGWFAKPLENVDDLKGLKIRAPGLGGELYRRLGATPVALVAADVLPALQSGVVDAVEFQGPAADMAVGFQKVTRIYYGPGFNRPNGALEAIVSIAALEKLAPDLREILAAACQREHATGLGAADWANAVGLATLGRQFGVTATALPDAILRAARMTAETLLDETAAKDAASGEIVGAMRAARERLGLAQRVSTGALIDARDG